MFKKNAMQYAHTPSRSRIVVTEEFRFRRLISRKCRNDFAHVAAKTMTSMEIALTRVSKITMIPSYVSTEPAVVRISRTYS